ncbi:flavin reductase family protein [Nocardioides sp.]|uniref:flavin reductase family protein n=1 Tax=Nocardioides sp. TaxID=35761 RepID=UPI0026068991|nr:flavin reductase family protein [Nocardioides sp.]
MTQQVPPKAVAVDEPQIEPRHFRETLGHYPTGVVVVTATTPEHGRVAMVVGSFTSASLEPPLIAFMPQRSSATFARLRTADSFCVNVLAADQEDLCRRIATGEADLDQVGWTPGPTGAPILDGVVAWIDCAWHAVTDAGDHHIVLGRVEGADVVRQAQPLLFFQGGYGRFSLPSLVATAQPDLLQGIRLAELARDQIEAVAEEFGAECSVLTTVGQDSVCVAMATRSQQQSHVSLGFHLPLVPPVGSVFITSLGSVAINDWLSRVPAADDAMRERLIGQLERVRERGYSLSLHGPLSDAEIYDITRNYSSPDRLPEDERRFQALIRTTADLYEPDIDPAGTYDLHSIVVPVEGPMQLVQIVLRLSSTPMGASGADVLGWVERLQEAARVVSERVVAASAAQLDAWS